MSSIWSKEEIKEATIAPRIGIYEFIPQTTREEKVKEKRPDMFRFNTLSIGLNRKGQLFFVPLDESSKENAEYILRAIAAYKGE